MPDIFASARSLHSGVRVVGKSGWENFLARGFSDAACGSREALQSLQYDWSEAH